MACWAFMRIPTQTRQSRVPLMLVIVFCPIPLAHAHRSGGQGTVKSEEPTVNCSVKQGNQTNGAKSDYVVVYKKCNSRTHSCRRFMFESQKNADGVSPIVHVELPEDTNRDRMNGGSGNSFQSGNLLVGKAQGQVRHRLLFGRC